MQKQQGQSRYRIAKERKEVQIPWTVQETGKWAFWVTSKTKRDRQLGQYGEAAGRREWIDRMEAFEGRA